MKGLTPDVAKVWEGLYGGGHALSYPNDVFVTISHRLLSPKTHPKVLDYGFGSGENVVHLLKRGFDVSGCEISESAIKTASARAKTAGFAPRLELFDGGRLPFKDGQFDAVIAWQVLNYNTWETFAKAVAEIDRVLKPGGIFLGAINAPGDFVQTHSEPLGDGLYRMAFAPQAGLLTLVVERERLEKAFPGRKLQIGHFGYGWDGVEVRYWVVSYRR